MDNLRDRLSCPNCHEVRFRFTEGEDVFCLGCNCTLRFWAGRYLVHVGERPYTRAEVEAFNEGYISGLTTGRHIGIRETQGVKDAGDLSGVP